MRHLSGHYHLVPAHYINMGCISLRDRSLPNEMCLVFFTPTILGLLLSLIDSMSKKSWTGQAGNSLYRGSWHTY